MASTIQIKRGTGSAVPSGLADGELAINLDDGKFYFGSASVSVSDFKFDTLTVTELTSSIITSSIIRSSGSNIFGDEATDTHTFVGNITSSGNISSSGNIIANTITAEHITSTDDMTITDDLIVNGNISGSLIIESSLYKVDSINFANVVGGTFQLAAGAGLSQIDIGKSNAATPVFINGSITSSNNISASGHILGDVYFTNNQRSLYNIGGTLNVGDGVGSVTVPQLTASGDISSSGTIFTDTLSSPGNSLSIPSDTVTITAGTAGEANLILEADTDNGDENDNPFMLFKQDGGGVAGMIGLSGDADKWPDGTTLTGVEVNALVIGMTGSAGGSNRQLYLAAGNSASLRVENDADIHIYENLNVAKAITVANTDVVDYDITNANKLTFGRANRDSIFQGTSFTVQTPITASSDISASGTVYTNKIDFNPANVYDYIEHNSTFGITVKTNDNKITLLGNVTASGAISASGDIMTSGTIQAGWHGSTTRIKILVSDFIPDDIGRPAMIDDTGSDRWLESHGTGVLFASIPIPTGFKATHVHVYGSGTSAMEVSEMNINSKSVTSKGTGNIGTELDITDVTSSTTNYLFIELAQASGEEVYGGYVTIVAV